MKKVRFIINPISGVGKKNKLPQLIEKHLNKKHFSYDIAYTQYRGHAHEIARSAIDENIDILVIAGGDGSISEISAALISSDVKLAIIPCGSGNGIARHFKIPLNPRKAIELINTQPLQTIDTGTLNERSFTGFCGFGYDALIAHRFDKSQKRGFWSYAKLVISEFNKFETIELECLESGKKWDNLFFCAVANTNQFGNNFKMSPGSNTKDGKLELVLVKKTNFIQFVGLLYRSYFGDIRSSKHTTTFSADRFHFKISTKLAHADGDPCVLANNTVRIACVPSSLHLIA